MARRLYLFAGGGTGGHLFPGLAVAEEIVAREPEARILFVGSDRPLEQAILSRTPFEHRALSSVSLAGAMRHPLRFLRRSWSARREALRMVDTNRPAAVIGCGGFASAAPVYAASRRGIPFILLEQNVIPGRATRWLSRLGGTVCLSFEQTAEHLHHSVKPVVTGNPVRATIANLARQRAGDHNVGRTLLVLGGSQGARSVNDQLISFAREHADSLAGWTVQHQTGDTDAQHVAAVYSERGIEATVAPFFDDMERLYRQATAVVSRAGATSLAEISCAGLPAVLMPYPHAADDHQRHNALAYEQAGAAFVVDERRSMESGEPDFAAMLCKLLSDEECREQMAGRMSALARPDAAQRVADVVYEKTSSRLSTTR